jgi:2-amino-4-hydroxy-6-hydroxymethyldihydropteridine diphosphokinase
MKKVYLALGSNIGNREQNLQKCVDLLETIGVAVLRASSVYETKPKYLLDQPLFLNLVLEAETDLYPRTLIKKLKLLEREMGRRPARPNRPRLIDIDILLFGKFVIETKDLVVPHPRMAERRFVLEPLAELDSGLHHPVSGQPIKEMLARTSSEGLKKVEFCVTIPSTGKGANNPFRS